MEPSKKHSIIKDGKKLTWLVHNLWESSEKLPPFPYKISEFDGFDEDFWFGGRHKPTLRKILEHHKKISEANFDYPIILSEDNIVMDGVHRICRAYLEGRESVMAVQFEVNPKPDFIEDYSEIS